MCGCPFLRQNAVLCELLRHFADCCHAQKPRVKICADIIRKRGQASITELAEKLQVSAIPFAAIQRTSKNKGWRRRIYGGAYRAHPSAESPWQKYAPAGDCSRLKTGSTADSAALRYGCGQWSWRWPFSSAADVDHHLRWISPTLATGGYRTDPLGGNGIRSNACLLRAVPPLPAFTVSGDIAILGACAHSSLGLSADGEADGRSQTGGCLLPARRTGSSQTI